MKYEELFEYYNKEMDNDGLQVVPSDIYDQMDQLVRELQKNLRHAPSMDDEFKVEDLLRNARMMISAIMELRQRKVLEAAFLDQDNGILGTVDKKRLAGREELLYEKILVTLTTYKKALPQL